MRIEVNHVSKSYQNQRVLKDVSLRSEGEIFGLIGPSGSGKTTLIRLMTGSLRVDGGSILLDGIPVPNKDLLKKIGYMPQNEALYSDLTGYQNLHFFGSLYHLKGTMLKERIYEVLAFAGLVEHASKKAGSYSGGMKKRLSLAAALLHRPGILFLDEPTVGIDPLLRKKIWDGFELLNKEGTTLIITTHVMDEAARCSRLGLIQDGALLATDTVSNLLAKTESGTIEELFIKGKAVDEA